MNSSPWSSEIWFILRQTLFLGPLFLTLILGRKAMSHPRRGVAALFAFLYAAPTIFVFHAIAIHKGLWSFDGAALKVLGFPADFWFGGSLLWGPAFYLAAPRLSPWVGPLVMVSTNWLFMPVLSPFLEIGPGWFTGVLIGFLTAHMPALYLARWTERDVCLSWRAFLLAVAYAAFAFFTLPTIVMHAMGGSWGLLPAQPVWALCIAGICLCAAMVLGLTAVQMFAVHGGGTPIPLDPTKRLVRTGIYAYLRNPMQVSTALTWLILGAVLNNIWIALAAVMAVVFVLGLVRWHHRQDLELRFPEGWPAYRDAVPEWFPRWRPAANASATFRYDADRHWTGIMAKMLNAMRPTNLEIHRFPGRPTYQEPDETQIFIGFAAWAKALNHTNILGALAGALILLIVLPAAHLGAVLARGLRVGLKSRA